ncbi:hypothetical protein BAZSYMA_ACONTIG189191_0 [Bathymodiolus azoricus thioautotrophic gill symbiont]|uniref:Uncharacterized protein n=1 Tax=Bathymodiolus azoricus thioautotrophic gill symbiont TaxID=235205 RepID=A0A1H6K9W2_9GAMM|nr:hypothetical protein BAZSYMA_ACONTIG189191_0 [Bathymodiolus azoricus thioautotrophic gill symbiont]
MPVKSLPTKRTLNGLIKPKSKNRTTQPKNTNQNPKKLPHSSLASIKVQTIPSI